MSAICNSIEFAAPESASGLFGNVVEQHIARGSAFFCSAAAEVFRFIAAGELGQVATLDQRLELVTAYLEACIIEYDRAITRAATIPISEQQRSSIAELDFAHLYERNVQQRYVPAMPAIWEQVTSVATSETPDQLLHVFRSEVIACLTAVTTVRQAVADPTVLETGAFWSLGSRITQSLAVGQAIATIYQMATQDPATLLHEAPPLATVRAEN